MTQDVIQFLQTFYDAGLMLCSLLSRDCMYVGGCQGFNFVVAVCSSDTLLTVVFRGLNYSC